MDNLTPSEVIKFRTECYLASDGSGVFSLYSMKSDLRKIFTEKEFCEHFTMLTRDTGHGGLQVVSETIRKNLAEVKYIERIVEGSELVTYYSKTALILESGVWRILREQRELKKG